MWLIMRGALGHANARELHRFYHVPASNTAVGHIVLEADTTSRQPATAWISRSSSRRQR